MKFRLLIESKILKINEFFLLKTLRCKAKKKNILDSQAPPHCPQSPRITDFFKPKKEKLHIKKICYFVVRVRPIFNVPHTFTRSSENRVGAWY